MPCRGVTWVSVLPTHRRRGVMRALLAEHEAECRRQRSRRVAAAQLAVRAVRGLRRRHAPRPGDDRDAGRGVPRPAARRAPADGRSERRAGGLSGGLGALPAGDAGFTTRPDPEISWTLKDLEGFCVFAGDDGYALYTVDRQWPGPNAEFQRQGEGADGGDAGRVRRAVAVPLRPHARRRGGRERPSDRRARAAPRAPVAARRRLPRQRRPVAEAARPRGAVRGARPARPGPPTSATRRSRASCWAPSRPPRWPVRAASPRAPRRSGSPRRSPGRRSSSSSQRPKRRWTARANVSRNTRGPHTSAKTTRETVPDPRFGARHRNGHDLHGPRKSTRTPRTGYARSSSFSYLQVIKTLCR